MNNIKLYFKDSIYLLKMALTEQQKKEAKDLKKIFKIIFLLVALIYIVKFLMEFV